MWLALHRALARAGTGRHLCHAKSAPMARDSGGRARPAGAYTQARRLMVLYDRLMTGGIVHAPREAAALGVSRRTVERDLAVLQDVLGPRLRYDEVPRPGWRVVGTARWSTTRWQVLAVALGARAVGFLSGRRFVTDVGPLLDGLRRSLPGVQGYRVHSLERKFHVVQSGIKPYHQDAAAQGALEAMLDGLLRERPVDLRYLSNRARRAGEGPRALRVHPLAMVLYREAVYFIVDLLGPGERAEARRLLALDRIEGARLDAQAAARRPPRGFDAATFLAAAFGVWTGTEDHHVVVDIDAEHAPFVAARRWHASQVVTRLRDGGLRVELTLGALEEVCAWILAMTPHARAVAPPALRKMVRERLRAGLARQG